MLCYVSMSEKQKLWKIDEIMSFRAIKLITFDATNTLLKFRIPPWHYYALIAKDYGYRGTETDVKSRLIDSYKAMWKKYPNFGKSLISWDVWWQKLVERTFRGLVPAGQDVLISKILIEDYKTSKLWCVAEGGRQLLNLLDKKGIATGIISNFDPRLHDILKSVGIYKHFKFIITSYEFGCSKPNRKIFMHAMGKSGVIYPSECLHVGDDVKKDYEAAILAGWQALIVPSGENALIVETENPPPPEHIYKSLKELADAIEEDKVKLY